MHRLSVLAALVVTFPSQLLSTASPLVSGGQSIFKVSSDSEASGNFTSFDGDSLFHTQGFMNAIASHAEEHELFTVVVHLNDKEVNLLLDTGSTATWVGTVDTKCEHGRTGDNNRCKFKNKDFVLKIIQPEESFTVSYGGEEEVNGIQGDVNVQALFNDGPKKFEAKVGVATDAIYNGRNVDQGVMGLAPEAQDGVDQLPPILRSYAQGTHQAEAFALALSGDSNKWSVIRFGGGLDFDWEAREIHVDKTIKAENVPIWVQDPTNQKGVKRQVQAGDKPHDWTIEAKTFHVHAKSKAVQSITHDMMGKAVVDSGTDHLVLPLDVVRLIHASYNPPVTGDKSPMIPCNYEPPLVAVEIAGTKFPIDANDLKMRWPDGKCQSMIEAVESETHAFLGTPFLKNVVAAHDVTAGTMSFYRRTG
jgi:hypothetical protein